jgi:hypothetical protein
MDALQGEFLAALVMGVLAVTLWLLVVVIVRRWLRREQNQVEPDEA